MQYGHQLIDKSPQCLDHWTFEFGYCLGFGYWDLGFSAYNGGSGLILSYRTIINFNVPLA